MGIRLNRRNRWMLLPALMGIVLFGGCSVRGAFGGGSTTSPAEQTVTAIVKTATVTTGCATGTGSPVLRATMMSTSTNGPVTVGVFKSTIITLVGTCWLPGNNIFFAAVAKGADGNRIVVPLTPASAPPSFATPTPVAGNPQLKQPSKGDGTFTITFALAADLAPSAVDNHLTFIAYSDSYQQVAATSIQVSS